MGFSIGLPSLKLNNVGNKSKHCGSFKKVAEEALKERLGLDLDINPELATENVYIGIETAEELMQYSAEHIAEMDYNRPEGAKKIRSDAVVMCSTIIKPPMEMMDGLDRQQQERFLRDAYDSFLEIIGAENAKSAVMHFDELSPHIHIFWEPMTEDGRLCAKEKHNLKFFGKLNREMPQMLRDKGWDIDDCQAYDKAKEDALREELGEEKYRERRKEQKAQRKQQGKDSRTFKHEAEQAVKQLEEQKTVLENDIKELQEQKISTAKKPKLGQKTGFVTISTDEYQTLISNQQSAEQLRSEQAEIKREKEQMRSEQAEFEREKEQMQREKVDLQHEGEQLQRREKKVKVAEMKLGDIAEQRANELNERSAVYQSLMATSDEWLRRTRGVFERKENDNGLDIQRSSTVQSYGRS